MQACVVHVHVSVHTCLKRRDLCRVSSCLRQDFSAWRSSVQLEWLATQWAPPTCFCSMCAGLQMCTAACTSVLCECWRPGCGFWFSACVVVLHRLRHHQPLPTPPWEGFWLLNWHSLCLLVISQMYKLFFFLLFLGLPWTSMYEGFKLWWNLFFTSCAFVVIPKKSHQVWCHKNFCFLLRSLYYANRKKKATKQM